MVKGMQKKGEGKREALAQRKGRKSAEGRLPALTLQQTQGELECG